MSEYLIQDTTLDAIADAINAKTGGTSAMTPAEMVTAIGTISGGGGSDDLFESSSGSFTLDSPLTDSMSIQHGLSKTPFYVLVIAKENVQMSANSRLGGIAVRGFTYIVIGFYGINGTMTQRPRVEANTSNNLYVTNLGETTFSIAANENYPYPSGIEFEWRAFAFKG